LRSKSSAPAVTQDRPKITGYVVLLPVNGKVWFVAAGRVVVGAAVVGTVLPAL